MSGPPEMSKTTREILAKVKKMVPPMLEKFHKGKRPSPNPNQCRLLILSKAKWAEWRSLEAVKIILERLTSPQWQVPA
jgi:hypothetical protein